MKYPPQMDEVKYQMTLDDGAVIERMKHGGNWVQVSPPRYAIPMP